MNLPTSVRIVDITYAVEYFDKISEVDSEGVHALYGQIDYVKRTIRVHRGNRALDDVWQTLWHEMLHGISERLRIQDNQLHNDENAIDLLAIGINVAMQAITQ